MVYSDVLAPDTVLNERYRLEQPIGEGGMATVYRARDTRLRRTVAIKVLHAPLGRDQPFVQRFQQEAEFAASLGAHPNIVAIYDIGQADDLHYIVMELIEGRSLKVMIQERAPIPVPETFAIGAQVASALDFAHKRGLVHRDVKPQNIVVTPQGVAKVTDFGIARSISASQMTKTGMVIGTVHYFSPEQAQGKPAEPASDIYSLGVILFEMLTAHLLFDAETPIGVAMKHVHDDPPSPWYYNSSLPPQAVATVMRALEKDPSRRYRDAAEFASALGDQPFTTGATTTISPLDLAPEEQTARYQTVPPAAPMPVEYVAEEPAVQVVRPLPPPVAENRHSFWMIAGAAVLALAVGLAAFFATNRVLSGSASPTPTPTATASPKPTVAKKKRTAVPTVPVFIAPTSTPLPPATFTPAPATPTVAPTAKPTQVPTPTTAPTTPPTDTPIPATPGPSPTSTFLG